MSGLQSQPLDAHQQTRGLPARVQQMLANADIRINGSRPWDMQIHHPRTLSRIALQRSLGLGESYMDGWWDCKALDQFFYRLLRHGGDSVSQARWQVVLQWLGQAIFNRQSLSRATKVAEQHYDLDNHLFETMLDSSMSYSCGYWRNADTLEQAQYNKLDLICRKLQLEPGMTLLDIGCGWGGLLHHASQHYGIRGVGVTLSEEQASLARQRCRDLPVDIELQDYRKVQGTFDRVVSVGMFEHVGRKNYATFMKHNARLLKRGGLMLLHTIGNNFNSHRHDPWIDKYIFPNGELPSIRQISRAAEPWFVPEDVHNFGPDYATTLRAWDDNFCRHWPQLQERYDQRFYRMWRYYLNCCAGAFQARDIQLWQWVFSKPGEQRQRYTAAR
ncbi:cyclopropane fatty acyl phospholipid synthase [Alcanivorax hongdengensis A-11-3]|uniref:Cyclopropane fatty acyl phospholipid synthase n=1 Tax=Alcanivorax hongdengensis A-11-3 TaxID=1177179 RepID=L0WJJ1_9GAMM|nr:cyclopropane fatty acyl phospholipid synthase [Alcanivorax hongdengensis]EKF76000.1 cyclopropane fatty acyl phospholipid synthase [Alcanivorax hongdengensis A-11-3]